MGDEVRRTGNPTENGYQQSGQEQRQPGQKKEKKGEKAKPDDVYVHEDGQSAQGYGNDPRLTNLILRHAYKPQRRPSRKNNPFRL